MLLKLCKFWLLVLVVLCFSFDAKARPTFHHDDHLFECPKIPPKEEQSSDRTCKRFFGSLYQIESSEFKRLLDSLKPAESTSLNRHKRELNYEDFLSELLDLLQKELSKSNADWQDDISDWLDSATDSHKLTNWSHVNISSDFWELSENSDHEWLDPIVKIFQEPMNTLADIKGILNDIANQTNGNADWDNISLDQTVNEWLDNEWLHNLWDELNLNLTSLFWSEAAKLFKLPGTFENWFDLNITDVWFNNESESDWTWLWNSFESFNNTEINWTDFFSHENQSDWTWLWNNFESFNNTEINWTDFFRHENQSDWTWLWNSSNGSGRNWTDGFDDFSKEGEYDRAWLWNNFDISNTVTSWENAFSNESELNWLWLWEHFESLNNTETNWTYAMGQDQRAIRNSSDEWKPMWNDRKSNSKKMATDKEKRIPIELRLGEDFSNNSKDLRPKNGVNESRMTVLNKTKSNWSWLELFFKGSARKTGSGNGYEYMFQNDTQNHNKSQSNLTYGTHKSTAVHTTNKNNNKRLPGQRNGLLLLGPTARKNGSMTPSTKSQYIKTSMNQTRHPLVSRKNEEEYQMPEFKEDLQKAMPLFHPDSKQTPQQDILRKKMCKVVTKLYGVKRRCCRVLSKLCPEFVTENQHDTKKGPGKPPYEQTDELITVISENLRKVAKVLENLLN